MQIQIQNDNVNFTKNVRFHELDENDGEVPKSTGKGFHCPMRIQQS